ncbi:helix-turn-helix domain-containing protein [Luteimonas wenzhouensis]|uniref:Bacteriophage CI repressor n=1 Tax=Luteimonas wenzhouensis TaxID=2599615 RepID=A0A5C5TVT8_9GAMM|nr:helix-turn-helix domain-containing protein [Luteimonas wenzhouensis]TWT18311.1 bacteriophage CI repressor [Luteimonas wenzhouensis]
MELAIRIRRARTRKQYSQLELASLLNVGRSAVANWECGAKIPSSLRLQHIAMVTDVSFEWLATGRGSAELGDQWTPAAEGMMVDDPEEMLLLQRFRACSAADKRAVVKLLAAVTRKRSAHVYMAAGAARGLGVPLRVAHPTATEEDEVAG